MPTESTTESTTTTTTKAAEGDVLVVPPTGSDFTKAVEFAATTTTKAAAARFQAQTFITIQAFSSGLVVWNAAANRGKGTADKLSALVARFEEAADEDQGKDFKSSASKLARGLCTLNPEIAASITKGMDHATAWALAGDFVAIFPNINRVSNAIYGQTDPKGKGRTLSAAVASLLAEGTKSGWSTQSIIAEIVAQSEQDDDDDDDDLIG